MCDSSFARSIPETKSKTRVAELVSQYASHIKEYKSQTYNETEVRVDYVNPFFEILGWDMNNNAGLPQHLREVTHEATVLVAEDGQRKSKKPDYSFRVGTETLFYLETKKPSVDITVDRAPAFQLRRYGWSGNLKVSVLTNFNDLYIYDCSVRPIENDDISIALIAHYSFEEYVDKFGEIYSLLSKEAVLSGEFASRFENIRGAFRHEPFDQYFLMQIRNWRLALGNNIRKNNPDISLKALNISVQRILNRIIFLRICEDRSFEKYELLKSVQTYDELKKLFLVADKKYDSGLFEILDEDRIRLSDDVLLDIFKNLYYPNNSYEFSVVDPFVIGLIYEMFLLEQLDAGPEGTVVAVEKPEAVDSQGAVNTPKNVTDAIIEQTLSVLLSGKTPEEIETLRIADICCGSGNFLLSSFEYIINYYINWHLTHDKEAAIRNGVIYLLPGTDEYRLSFDVRRKILINNIWGVDIDPLATEVTKFSLYLKLLESTTLDEMLAFSRAARDKLLPRLDSNIKNGNSLVDMSYARFEPNIYDNIPMLQTIKMFDWQAEFGKDGFDAIVGNPPYIRVQNLVRHSPSEYAFYKSEYSGYLTAETELMDKYYLFIERAWSLLKEGGLIGYIVPHKFMNILSGETLRRYLADQKSVSKIIHFGVHQVFSSRSTYTCILVLAKMRQAYFDIAFVSDWNRFLFDHTVKFDTYSEDILSEKPWTFIPSEISARLSAIQPRCSRLNELADIFVGVQTSADKVYIIYPTSEDDEYVYFTDKNQVQQKVEKGILRKSVYDARLRRYEQIEANSYIIFPYENSNGRPRLIDIEAMKSHFPATLEYLSSFREELDKRNRPNRTDENWYAYGRSQSLRRFVSEEHLIWPVLSLDANYVYDKELVVFTGGGNGPFYGIEMKKQTRESIFYVQAILNHWLMELLVKKSASTFRGGYYSHGKQFIEQLPIYRINFDERDQARLHDEIVERVHQIERLTISVNAAQDSATKSTLRRSVIAANDDLNAVIDRIYGVEGLRMENADESD